MGTEETAVRPPEPEEAEVQPDAKAESAEPATDGMWTGPKPTGPKPDGPAGPSPDGMWTG